MNLKTLWLGLIVGGVIGMMIGCVGSGVSEQAAASNAPRENSTNRQPSNPNTAVAVVDLSRLEYRRDRRFSDILWLVGVSHAIGTDDIVEKSLREVRIGIEAGMALHNVSAERE